jgi:hypothetical protein
MPRVCHSNTIMLSKGVFVSRKMVSGKPLSKLSCVCLSLGKLVNGKHFPVKGKFGLVSRKVFSFYFRRKTLSGSCKRFRNVILFADYIKFGHRTFDCVYIFCFESLFFNFIPENLIFILTFVLIFIIIIYFFLIIFLIEIFYLSNLVLILLIVTYFI